MKKTAAFLLSSLLVTSAQSIEIGRGKAISNATHMLEIYVSEERAKYGDVNAECTLLDQYKQPIDTVKTKFTQDRMPLYFRGRYWHVYHVSCRLKASS